MSNPDPSPTCAVIIGNLVPRPCGEAAKTPCAKCKRLACAEHGQKGDKGWICKHCASGKPAPVPVMDVPYDMAFQPADLEAFQVERSDDPANAWADLT